MRYALYMTLLIVVLPFVFSRPFFGLCVYYIVSILQPKFLCWRPEIQDAMLVGVPLVVGAILIGVKRPHMEPEYHPRTGRVIGVVQRLARSAVVEPTWPILLFGCLVAYLLFNRLVTPYPMNDTSVQFRSLCKILLVAAMVTGLASDYRRVRILYLVIALSAAFWAIKGGIKTVLLGPHQVYGKTYDNNLFALMSVMALPMVFYFGLSLKHARWRALLLAFSALVVLAIIGSRSRAGFLAMGAVVVCMAWSSRYRFRGLFAVLLVGVVTLFMVGQEVQERFESILAYRRDLSAFSRFEIWTFAWSLLNEHPLVGVGFNHFETARRAFLGGNRAAHNIYLQNLAELGLVGHPIWLLIIFGSLLSLFRFMHWSRRLSPDFRWAYHWSRGLLLAMVAFCIHGAFHNEEYYEFMFAIIGLNVALQVATRRALSERRLQDLAAETSRRRERRSRSRARSRRARDRDRDRLARPLLAFGLHPERLA